MRFQFLTDHVCIPFWKKTRYFGCSDVDCNFVSTHALWQAVFILKSSKRRILNYSCRHHLMWIGCKRNSQFGKVPLRQASWPGLPYSTEGTWRGNLTFSGLFCIFWVGKSSIKLQFHTVPRELGGNLEGTWGGELFLHKTGVNSACLGATYSSVLRTVIKYPCLADLSHLFVSLSRV